jgi:Tol biopolymer transport system component
MFDDSSLRYENLRAGTSRQLATVEKFTGPTAVSSDRAHVAFAYAADDSANLAVIELDTREIQHLHRSGLETEYSLSWSPDADALAFGFFSGTDEGERGPGAISIASLDGSTRSVGCQAAHEILQWLPDGRLAVRDSDNLYVVGTRDCETVTSLDIRKMHKITYAPDGRHMGYIFRDLVYDRENAEYVPDSTLFIAGAHGDDKNELFDDAYRARHLQWSPDGSDLAFGVRSEADRSRRQVIVYNVDDDRLTYLIPPERAGSGDEVQPRWSPSGDNIAFTLRRNGSSYAAVQVMGQTRTLGSSDGPVWGWARDRQVVFSGADSTRIVDLEGTTVHAFSRDRELLHVWPLFDGS